MCDKSMSLDAISNYTILKPRIKDPWTMTMIELLNLLFALLSIGLGAISWLWPRYTMSAIDLSDGGSTMGMSEVRAGVGCLWVGMGIGAILLATPDANVMLGACWLGAALGRGTSILIDGQSRQKWMFFTVEAVVGGLAIWLNLGG